MVALPADRRFAGWSWLDTGAALLLAVAVCSAATMVVRILFREQPQPAAAAAVSMPPERITHRERGAADFAQLNALFAIDTTGLDAEAGPTTEYGAEASVDPLVTPPQLTGVGILPDSRIAILRFASGLTRVMKEGEQWEQFTVETIRSEAVRVRTSDTTYVLQRPGSDLASH